MESRAKQTFFLISVLFVGVNADLNGEYDLLIFFTSQWREQLFIILVPFMPAPYIRQEADPAALNIRILF